MLIEHDREKLINSIIYFSKNTKYCGKTKLFKLLYYLDFMHFRETGRSVTGLDYFAWDYGPVPRVLFSELNNPEPDLRKSISISQGKGDRSFKEIRPRKKFDGKHFTRRELRLIETLAYIFKEARAENIVEASHLPNHPWDRTIRTKGEKAEIDYLLAIDDTDNSLPRDEARERINDREAIKKALLG